MIDEMFQVDELQQLCGYGLKICDGLEIRQPTVGDIVKLGESEYFNMVYTLTAIPSDMKAQLDQMGIDWEKIEDFEKRTEENFKVDLTIARGLDYYTGTVYETFLNNYRELGSVCSGGRYENLAEYYTDKKLPGVGISIGLTRLFYKLNELNLIKADKKSISDVLIIPMIEDLSVPISLATKLRNNGINTEIYLNNKKLKAKFKYADKLEIPYVIIIGEDEINSNKFKLKNMSTGDEKEIDFAEIDNLRF